MIPPRIEAIALNLIAAVIGFLVAHGIRLARQYLVRRTERLVWNPTGTNEIIVYPGRLVTDHSHVGEIEPSVNIFDAITLGELRVFLERHFRVVNIVSKPPAVDWNAPVVSLGGPIPNVVTRNAGTSGKLPLWFLDMPYTDQHIRSIGNKTQKHISQFDDNGCLVKDVGFFARISSGNSSRNPLFIVAGNYGVGTLGVIKHFTSPKKLKEFRRACKANYFQAIIEATTTDDRITDTRLVSCIPIE